MREHWVRERTALINWLRALMAEFGIIMPTGRVAVQREIPLCLEDVDNSLPAIARAALADSYDHLQVQNQRIEDTEQCFDMVVEVSPNAQRIMKVRGIGSQPATAVLASIGKDEQFDNGRDFAAWLGLILNQYSRAENQGSVVLASAVINTFEHCWYTVLEP